MKSIYSLSGHTSRTNGNILSGYFISLVIHQIAMMDLKMLWSHFNIVRIFLDSSVVKKKVFRFDEITVIGLA